MFYLFTFPLSILYAMFHFPPQLLLLSAETPTGGSVMVDSKDPDVQKALMFATDSLNKMENSMYYRSPVKITEVKSQVILQQIIDQGSETQHNT